MRKVLTILVLSTLVLLCACGRGSESSSSMLSEDALADPVSLSVGYTASDSAPIHTMLQDLADRIYSDSKGMISLDLYGEGELGSEKELTEQVMAGQLDAAVLSSDTLLPYCPKISVLRLPFLFENYNEAEAVLNSKAGTEILSDLKDSHMIPLCYADGHLWQISNSLRPVKKPEDLTGMMLHTTGDELTLTVYENFAALPAPLDMEELPLSLQNHVFNGQVGSISDFNELALVEHQQYLSMMNIQYDTNILVASEEFWNVLPPSYQRLVKRCAEEVASSHRAFIQTNEETLLKGLRTSMDVLDPSLKSFKEQSEVIYEDYQRQNSWAEDLIAAIKAQRKKATAP